MKYKQFIFWSFYISTFLGSSILARGYNKTGFIILLGTLLLYYALCITDEKEEGK